ncbi:MAG: ATP synthase F1 subunit delta [Proteobacteria bacterium]|nr:ATP synthase F1 subunit delta [Pseudomonadota bacterium]
MISQSIAKRYAKGLFAVGEKNGKYREYLTAMETILEVFNKEQQLGKTLMLPILEMEKRKGLLGDIMKACDAPLPLANMFSMLLEKNRMGYIHLIKNVYSELVDEKEGRIRGTLYTAYPLIDTMKSRIEAELKRKLQKDVVLQIIEDRTLIGGVKVNVKGTIIDGSVKQQLETLKENILKE